MRNTDRIASWTLAAAVCLASLSWQACTLDFSRENFQRLRIFFQLTEALAAGEATLAHSSFFPAALKVRKRWVRISGRLASPGGAQLPGRVTVTVRFEDVASGQPRGRVSIKVAVDDSGGFSTRKKLAKNIVADSLMTITIEPAGTSIPRGTGVEMCVDLVEKKGDLGSVPDCRPLPDDGGSGGGEAVTLSELQASIFTPSCVFSGCHMAGNSRAGLELDAGRTFEETVNVASSQRPELDRIEPGDPENSYLFKKLRGDGDIQGVRMPDGGPFLSAEQMAGLASWITSGAPDN